MYGQALDKLLDSFVKVTSTVWSPLTRHLLRAWRPLPQGGEVTQSALNDLSPCGRDRREAAGEGYKT